MSDQPSSVVVRWHAKRHLAAALIPLAVLALAACSKEKPPEAATTANAATSAAMTVTVAPPGKANLPLRLQANGNIAAWEEAIVGAEVSGVRVSAVNVNVGAVVKKGQVLATFSNATAQAESLQGKATQFQAEASYQNAKAEADRARSIQNTGALSASQMAQYITQEAVNKAQWDAAKAAYSATRIRLGNTEVKAPDDGVISARTATVGAVVGAGQELFRLVRQGRLEWRADVTPTEVGRVQVGQLAQVTAATGLTVQGKVRAIAPGADPLTRNIVVYVDLPPQNELKGGTFAQGAFDLGQSAALTVRAQSVVVRDGHNYAFVIGADNKASQRKITTGRRVGEDVEVLEGLKPEDKVAVQGAGFLNEGDLVKVVQ